MDRSREITMHQSRFVPKAFEGIRPPGRPVTASDIFLEERVTKAGWVRGATSLERLAEPLMRSGALEELEEAEGELAALRARRASIEGAMAGVNTTLPREEARATGFDSLFHAAKFLAKEVNETWIEDCQRRSPELTWALTYTNTLSGKVLGVDPTLLKDLPDARLPCETREGHEEMLEELCGGQEPEDALAVLEPKIHTALNAVSTAKSDVRAAQSQHMADCREKIFLDPTLYVANGEVRKALARELGFLGSSIEDRYSPFIALYITGHAVAMELRSAVLRDNLEAVFKTHFSESVHTWAQMFRGDLVKQLVREAETIVLVASGEQLETVREAIDSRRLWVIMRDTA